jgi:hypothetical protein
MEVPFSYEKTQGLVTHSWERILGFFVLTCPVPKILDSICIISLIFPVDRGSADALLQKRSKRISALNHRGWRTGN